MFNHFAFENSRPDGCSVMEVVSDAASHENAARLFVPLQRTELRGEIAGPLAALHLTQVYGYTRAQCALTLEAVYRFPLPGDAAVTGVRVRFGEVEIVARLEERGQAEAEYQAAVRQGKQAALATRESPDVFTLQIAGLQPDQEVTVETSYVQLARVEGLDWSVRIPLTTAPRYVRADETGSRHAAGQPLLLLRDPGHHFALDLSVRGTATVTSPTHRLAVTAEEAGLRVRLADGEVLPDRDCILTWRPPQEEQRPSLRVMLHDDTASNHVYFLALVTPQSKIQNPKSKIAREAILLVDHSGSMQGAKWEAADWAVKRFLGGLTEEDTFALGLFHDQPFWLDAAPRPADPAAVAKAIGFLEARRDSGGTELGMALEQALHLPRSRTPEAEGGERARHVLIVTDAEVSDQGRLLRLADEERRRADRRRISLVCIDASPNSFLATELAERGEGVARFLTSSPEEADIVTALDAVLEEWAAPLLVGLRLEVDQAGLEVAQATRLPGGAVDLGDLPAGRAVWVVGRLPRGEAPEMTLRVTTADGTEVASRRVQVGRGEAPRDALKALFGARRVLGLEFLISSGADPAEALARLGYDPGEILAGHAEGKVYAENARAEAERRLRSLLVREALDYGIACAETAFVAVRTEAGKRIEGTVPVANALPTGWSEEFCASPARLALCQYPALRSAAAPGFAVPSRAAAPQSLGASPVSGPRHQEPSVLQRILSSVTGRQRAVLGNRRPPSTQHAGAVLEHAVSTSDSQVVLFSGVPAFVAGEAELFDSRRTPGRDALELVVRLSGLTVHYPDGLPDPARLDADLVLLLYVDDMTSPRARVKLVDLARQGGIRPVNIARSPGQAVRLVLRDPNGAWAGGAPRLELRLQ